MKTPPENNGSPGGVLVSMTTISDMAIEEKQQAT